MGPVPVLVALGPRFVFHIGAVLVPVAPSRTLDAGHIPPLCRQLTVLETETPDAVSETAMRAFFLDMAAGPPRPRRPMPDAVCPGRLPGPHAAVLPEHAPETLSHAVAINPFVAKRIERRLHHEAVLAISHHPSRTVSRSFVANTSCRAHGQRPRLAKHHLRLGRRPALRVSVVRWCQRERHGKCQRRLPGRHGPARCDTTAAARGAGRGSRLPRET